jgi:dynein heavy chain
LDPNPIQERLKNLVVTFKDAMPIVTALRNNYLEENHWDEIKTLINQTELNVKDENFTLKALIDMNVNQYQE